MKPILPLILVAALASAGCFSTSALVTVKPDGSGTVAQTMLMNATTAAQFGQIAGAMAKQHGTPGADKIPPNLDQLMTDDFFSEGMMQAMAAQMGEGVRLVSSEKVTEGPMRGVRASYAFDDISRVRLQQGGPGGGGLSEKAAVSFGFEKLANGNAILTIRMPAFSPEQAFTMPQGAPSGTDEETSKAMFAMMKPMMAGMRVDMALAVDGRLLKSSTPFAGGNKLTLISLNMDEVMASAEFMKNMTPPATIEEGKRRLQGMPGVKMVMDPEIVIEFSP